MTEIINRVIELMFVGPLIPASGMMCVLLLYSCVSMLGFLHLDLHHGDISVDGVDGLDGINGHADGHFDLGTISGFGAMTIRWLNISRVPLTIWVACFTLLWWIVSVALWLTYDQSRYEPSWTAILLLSARSAVIAIALTKLVTNPMTKLFVLERCYAGNIVGQECEILTGEANESFGQAKMKTDAAPLLLNVRTTGCTLKKGDHARITDFDETNRIYTISTIDREHE